MARRYMIDLPCPCTAQQSFRQGQRDINRTVIDELRGGIVGGRFPPFPTCLHIGRDYWIVSGWESYQASLEACLMGVHLPLSVPCRDSGTADELLQALALQPLEADPKEDRKEIDPSDESLIDACAEELRATYGVYARDGNPQRPSFNPVSVATTYIETLGLKTLAEFKRELERTNNDFLRRFRADPSLFRRGRRYGPLEEEKVAKALRDRLGFALAGRHLAEDIA